MEAIPRLLQKRLKHVKPRSSLPFATRYGGRANAWHRSSLQHRQFGLPSWATRISQDALAGCRQTCPGCFRHLPLSWELPCWGCRRASPLGNVLDTLYAPALHMLFGLLGLPSLLSWPSRGSRQVLLDQVANEKQQPQESRRERFSVLMLPHLSPRQSGIRTQPSTGIRTQSSEAASLNPESYAIASAALRCWGSVAGSFVTGMAIAFPRGTNC